MVGAQHFHDVAQPADHVAQRPRRREVALPRAALQVEGGLGRGGPRKEVRAEDVQPSQRRPREAQTRPGWDCQDGLPRNGQGWCQGDQWGGNPMAVPWSVWEFEESD